jgi:AAT family amino acid transporter
VSNLWRYGGFAPHGLYGLMLALPLVMFSFGGTELVGITAGEALDPTVSIPKAVNQVIWRILLFYVGAIAFIVMLVPWPEIGVKASPFVIAFSSVGLPGASNILNFVVITAALSAFNSGLYSTGRMLLTLSQNHQAPHVFTKISARGHVPVNGIMFSALVLSIGVVVEIVVPERAFVYLASVATMSLLFTWTMILVTQYRFRRIRRAEGTENELGFKLFYWPYSSALGFLLLAGVVVIMTLQSSTRLALYIAPVWFGALGAGYTTFVKGRVAPPPASTEPVSPRSGAE